MNPTVQQLILWQKTYNEVQQMYEWGQIWYEDYVAFVQMHDSMHSTGHWAIRNQEVDEDRWGFLCWMYGVNTNFVDTLIANGETERLAKMGIRCIEVHELGQTVYGIVSKMTEDDFNWLVESPHFGEYALKEGEYVFRS